MEVEMESGSPVNSPQMATVAEKVKAKPKTGKKSDGPSTFSLIKEALARTDERNGLSYYAIRAYVAHNYPDVASRSGFIYRTKTALVKGLQTGVFKRPKKDADISKLSVGRFKLVIEKPKKPKKVNAKDPNDGKKNVRGRSKSPKKPASTVAKKAKPAARSLSAEKTKASKKKSGPTATKKLKSADRSPSADRSKSPKRATGSSGKMSKSPASSGKAAGKEGKAVKKAVKPRPRSKTLTSGKSKIGKASVAGSASKPAVKRAKSASPAPAMKRSAPKKVAVPVPVSTGGASKPKASKKTTNPPLDD